MSAVLILIGCFMLKPIVQLDFDDYTELVPAFLTIVLISFTYNIGMTAGFIAYPLLKLAAGRGGEVKPALWVMAALSLLFYLSYPYR